MIKWLKHPLFLLALVCFLVYGASELIIRGEALNHISFGIAGYFFWGGVALLIFSWIIVPIFGFALFPEWIDPQTLSDPIEQLDFLERYGRFLVRNYRKNPPPEIADSIEKLRDVIELNNDPAECRIKLLDLVPRIHQELSEKVCSRIIHDYMKKTAIIVCISQRGWLDSTAMLLMQIRMVIDLSKALGYRPSWYSVLYCLGWIFINSILFSIFDGTDILDNALTALLPNALKKSLGKMILFFGKITVEALTSMAIVWTSGKIVQCRLLGEKKRLSGKDRIAYRVNGYKEARKIAEEKIEKVLGIKDGAAES